MYHILEFIADFCFKGNEHIHRIQKFNSSHSYINKNDIFSLWTYKDIQVRSMIRFMKKHRSSILSKKIGLYAFEYIQDYLSDQHILGYFKKPLVVPIPIDTKRLKERGFNQNHLWGKSLGKKINGVYCNNILRKVKHTQKQALIKKRSERFLNVKNSFAISPKNISKVYQKDIILIDDLTTTGATLLEAKNILTRAGARNILMLTLAH